MHSSVKLILLATLACGSLALCGCSGKAERVASHLQRGQSFYAKSDPEKALLEVRNVLQMDPKNEPAIYLAGQVEESRGEFQRAFQNYSKAVELKPDDWNAQAAISRLYLDAGELPKAQAGIDKVLAKAPENAEAQVVEAALLARAGKVEEAISRANQIKFQTRPPENATVLLAALYASQHQEQEGLSVVEAALAGDASNPRLLGVAAQLSARLNDPQKANRYFTLATGAAPKSWELWRAWADDHDRRQEIDQAEQVLRAAIKAEPEDSKRYIALSEYLFARRGKDAGFRELNTQAALRPKDYPIQFALSQAYVRAGQADEARKVLQGIAKQDAAGPSGLVARNLLAADALARGSSTDARALLEEVLKANPRDGTALTLRGEIELVHGDFPAAIADLRSAVRDRPDSARVVGLLAQAHLANKEPELARNAISDAVKLFPQDVELAILQANFLARLGDPGAALEALQPVVRDAPKNRHVVETKAAIELSQNDAAAAERTYKEYVQHTQDAPDALLLLGKFYLGQKNYAAALAQFDAAAKLLPTALEPRLEAVTALVDQGRLDEAARRVDAAVQSHPDDPANLQMLGEVKLLQKDASAATSAFNRELALDPHAVKAYVDLGRAQLLKNDFDGAVATLEKGIAASPSDPRLYVAEAEFLARSGKVDAAIAVYDRLLDVAPNDDIATNNVAYLLTQYKTDKPSLERALALAGRFAESENPAYLDSLGWVHYKLGQYDQALPVLQQAVNLEPSSPLLQLHLGMTLYKGGDVEKAKEHLRIAADSKQRLPELDEAKRILGEG